MLCRTATLPSGDIIADLHHVLSRLLPPAQTQPLYLAQLLFLLPPSGSASFMETLVFSLFNYGSDRRDAFLLLQLFTAALRYEIR